MRTVPIGLVILTVSTLACGGGPGGGGPSAPTNTTTTPTLGPCTDHQNCPNPTDTNGIFIGFLNNGESYSFTFAGQSFSGTGSRDFQFAGIAGGDYEVSGQLPSKQHVLILLMRMAAKNTKGGVRPASVQSLEGPLSGSRSCVVEYEVPSGATLPQKFRFKFTYDTSILPSADPTESC